MQPISLRLASELTVNEQQVISTMALLDDGATVPFIARYRKEVTGGLDDTQLRTLAERLIYLRELDDRRESILAIINEQGKLSEQLKKDILAAPNKTTLEDLYLPYKKKRRSKAQIAREAGLAPVAESLLADPTQNPAEVAGEYLNKKAGFADIATVLEGARQILMENFAENAQILGKQREFLWQNGMVVSSLAKSDKKPDEKYSDYFEFTQAIAKIPSHRALALLRGRNDGVLTLKLKVDNEEQLPRHPCETMVANHFNIQDRGRAADPWLQETVRMAWKIKISAHLDTELKGRLKEIAETEAIDVFANNLRDLLLAAPASAKTIMGLDPGIRTGVKVAVIDATGKLLDTATIYPHAPKNQWLQAQQVLTLLCHKHSVALISIGNGTASRETDRLVADLIKQQQQNALKLQKMIVSEAGASVYSASALAAKEFPDLDVSLRGAVSIARRLQDPLAELVKIDPKSIGVGQYQHDLNQYLLARKLEAIVEDCVNAVGVDVNRASVPLLAQVAGLGQTLAENIVHYRDTHGVFKNRQTILKVPRMGPKAFEQAGGFLRVVNGSNPLDNSAVHPESYPVVERIIASTQKDIKLLIGDSKVLSKLNPARFTDDTFGIPTVTDIIAELKKPGRDPRPEFKTAAFQAGVEKIADLAPEMILEGVVSNVTNFGAFVDIGVHQDGLVHISMLADKFVKDPRQVVKAGDVVKVKVLAVDLPRKRISLTMKLNLDSRDYQTETPQKSASASPNHAHKRHKTKQQHALSSNVSNSALADALKRSLGR